MCMITVKKAHKNSTIHRGNSLEYFTEFNPYTAFKISVYKE